MHREMYEDHEASNTTYENGPLPYEDFPQSEEPVYLLGEKYSTLYDLEELRHDVLSRLWFTYRRNFPAIGGTGPTSDTGWGCMLRCGQMMLAQALICRHLGKEWKWQPGTCCDKYLRILKMFQDKKSSYYSIHQIASMGASEGKAVGQWFGPNTIAQVLKKIAVFDDWSDMVMHVSMDNTVIENDIRQLCTDGSSVDKLSEKENRVLHNNRQHDISFSSNVQQTHSNLCDSDPMEFKQTSSPSKSVNVGRWRPLLLVIPLRLGLSDINPVYIDSLKSCLSFRQSVGIIGGKPNHAHWFIGYLGDELIYLDPHTSQLTVDLDEKGASDDSYHCPFASRMKMHQLDPSIAVGFFCATEADFNDLCTSVMKFIVSTNRTPLFELHKMRPAHWPPLQLAGDQVGTNSEFFDVAATAQCDSDEEFELIG